MSAICGALHFGGAHAAVVPKLLERMLTALEHRGAFERRTVADGGIALAERGSAPIEPREASDPATSEDGHVTAVLDGAIFNEAELRAELTRAGHVVRTDCPAELIAHLYEEHGTSFPGRIRGDFAFGLWDARRRRAVLGRDHMGVRPLYYAQRDGLLLFASELKSVLASGLVPADLDYEAIDAYLAFGCVPAPRTLLAGASKLQAAHCLIVEPDATRSERFWEYPLSAEPSRRRGVDRHAEELRSLLDEAVRIRMNGHAGALLSSGLDSSLVVALLTAHASEPVKTFTVGFTDPGQPNELAGAGRIADALGTEHRELALGLAQETSDLTDFIWSLDEPVADFGALGLLAGARLAGRHVPVCFSGIGADAAFGGLPRMLLVAGLWDRLPRLARLAGRRLLARGSARMRRAARTLAARPTANFLVLRAPLAEERRGRVVRGELAARDGDFRPRLLEELLRGVHADPLTSFIAVDQLLAAEFHLHTFDRASALGGLEMRLPFFDHRVVEYAARIPNRLKMRPWDTKILVKHAARGLVPDDVIDKRKVAFLYDSRAAWLRAQIPGAIGDFLLAPAPRSAEFLERREIEAMIADHAESTSPGETSLLFALLLLEIWLSAYLPRALRVPAAAGS